MIGMNFPLPIESQTDQSTPNPSPRLRSPSRRVQATCLQPSACHSATHVHPNWTAASPAAPRHTSLPWQAAAFTATSAAKPCS